ncbi:MAG: Hsp20/alpha crystallin family protein [Synergistaceae bacterium]|nr:Hsp20/alpha crystallin family protein [Synergistaceae bacterium]
MMMPKIFGENLFDDWMDDFGFRSAFPAVRGNSVFGKHEKGLMKTDVKEKDGSYLIDMDLPGFKKEDVKAELNDGYLTVSASRSYDNEGKDENGSYIRRERFSGSCSRTFYVGGGVKQEDIKAKFDNGILSLTVPKESVQKLPENRYIAIEG